MRRLIALVTACLIFATVSGRAVAASTLPEKPLGVTLQSQSPSDTDLNSAVVGVSWNAAAGAVAYATAAVASAHSTEHGSSPTCNNGTCNSTISNLAGGVSYDFFVTAFDSAGASTTSDPMTFTPRSVPASPIAISSVGGAGLITLTWQSPANTGGLPLTGYVISDGVSNTQKVASDQSSYTFNSLASGTSYLFSIAAQNALGSSTKVNFVSASTFGVPLRPLAPSASVSGANVSASWVAPQDGGSPITQFKVYLLKDGVDIGAPNIVTAGMTTSFTTSSNGTYTVQVVAHNDIGDSARSLSSNGVSVTAALLANLPVFSPSTLRDLIVDQSQEISATTPSGDAPVFTTNTPVCTYSGGKVTAVEAGVCTITANVAARANYEAGASSVSFSVRRSQTITFPYIGNHSGTGSVSLNATASSGLQVYFTSTGICTVSAFTLNLNAIGLCSVTAIQPGDLTFAPATPVTRSFLVVDSVIAGNGSGGTGSGTGSGTGGIPGIPPQPPVTFVSFAKPSIVSIPSSGTSKLYFEIESGESNLKLSIEVPSGSVPQGSNLSISVLASDTNAEKGILALSIQLSDAQGVWLKSFDQPLRLSFSRGLGEGLTVVYSQDSFSWNTIQLLSGDTLPDGLGEGYLIDSNGNLKILTRHLTVFAMKSQQPLLASKVKVSSIKVGKSIRILTSGGAGTGRFSYKALSPKICSVSKIGLIRALKLGTCKVLTIKGSDPTYIDAVSLPLKLRVLKR